MADKKAKMVFTVPPVKLNDKDLAWISEQLVEVDTLYMYFGLTQPEWTVILKNNPNDYASVKRNVLLSWRKKQGANATLAGLVSALSEPDNVDVTLIQSIIQHFNVNYLQGSCSHPVQVSDESGDTEQPRTIHNLEEASNSGVANTQTPSLMDIIYQLNPQMIKYINMVSLIPYLNKYGILTSEERFYLSNNHKSPTEKVNYLLTYLESKDEKTVKSFLKALKEAREHSGHTELCRLLRERGVEI